MHKISRRSHLLWKGAIHFGGGCPLGRHGHAACDKGTSATVYSGRGTADSFSKKDGQVGNHAGKMHRAVPASNARLIIAPTNHLRNSFSYALGEFGITDLLSGSLRELDSWFYELFFACGMEAEFPSDWTVLLAALQDVAFERIRPAFRLSTDTEKVLAALVKNKEHLIDFLDNAFSPYQNGFTVVDFSGRVDKEEYRDNEIWMAEPCLFIEEELFERMAL